MTNGTRRKKMLFVFSKIFLKIKRHSTCDEGLKQTGNPKNKLCVPKLNKMLPQLDHLLLKSEVFFSTYLVFRIPHTCISMFP